MSHLVSLMILSITLPLLSCGGGTQIKVRECVLPDVRSLQQCEGSDKISRTCNEDPCPALTPWSDWSECSRSCGGGTRSKRRDCVYPRDFQPDNDCLEQLEMSESCNENLCPEYGQWSPWTACTKVEIQQYFISISKLSSELRRWPETEGAGMFAAPQRWRLRGRGGAGGDLQCPDLSQLVRVVRVLPG